jgi:hypothetical protein
MGLYTNLTGLHNGLYSNDISVSKKYLFDFHPGAYVGYSCQRLSSLYRGAAIQCTFTGYGDVDVPFLGSTIDYGFIAQRADNLTVTVKKIYDQSGNGRHAILGTAAKIEIYNSTTGLNFQTNKKYLQFQIYGNIGYNVSNPSLSESNYTVYTSFLPNTDYSSRTLQYMFDTQTGRLIIAGCALTAGKPGYYDGTWNTSTAAVNLSEQYLTWALGYPVGNIYRNLTNIYSGSYTKKAIGGSVAMGDGYDLSGVADFSGNMNDFIIYPSCHPIDKITGIIHLRNQVFNIL